MKIRSLLLLGAVTACATSQSFADTPPGPPEVNGWLSYTADFSTPNPGGGIAGTTNQVININISGMNTWDPVSDPQNEIMLIDMATLAGFAPGSLITIVSIGWNTNQQTVAPGSWLSEMRMYFDDNVAPNLSGLFLAPGAGVNNAGPPNSFASGVQIDLTANNIPNIPLPNGILRLEFFDSFDDAPGAIDGTFLTGSSISIGILEVPGPGALALLGVAGLIGSRRRRS